MSAITAKASRKMKKYAVLTREPRCFLGSFDFSWEQRKAIDIADYSKGNGYSKGDLTDAGTPIILYGRLYTKYQFAISEVDTFAFPRNGAVYSQGNEVIVPASGETAEDIARASAVEKSGVLLGGDLNILRPFDFINPLFLALAISNGEPQKELAKKAQGKSVVHIHNTDIQEVTIAYPSRTEQDRIVSVFRQLDNLITLHQRKCANLCSPSQVVFSLLFATSTFSWEQRKLGDVVQITMGQSPDGSTYSDEPSDYILVQGNADLQNGWVCPRIWTTQITKKADAGDLIMSVRAPAGAMGKTAYNAVIGRGVAAIKGNEFIYQLLVKMDMDGFWKTLSCGSTFESLNSDNIKNAEVKVPITAEQVQIGNFFRQLDNLITLHQRECISFTGRADRLILTANKKRTTSSWEQRKAKELFVSTADKGYPELPVLSATQDRGMIRRDENSINIFHDKKNEAGYKRVLPGQFVIHLRSFQGGFAHSAIEGITSPAYTVFGFSEPEKHDSEYWKYVFTSKSFIQRLETVTYGIRDGRSISYEEFLTLGFVYPSKAEQTAIARYLDKLSDLITLHQRKGKAAVSGCSNDANNSKGVCCKARDFGYKCHKKDEPNRFDA